MGLAVSVFSDKPKSSLPASRLVTSYPGSFLANNAAVPARVSSSDFEARGAGSNDFEASL